MFDQFKKIDLLSIISSMKKKRYFGYDGCI